MHILELPGGRPGGPTIILLHGLASRATDWLAVARPLARHAARVICPDLPGHGWSDLPSPTDDVRALERRVVQALAVLVPEPAVLIGNSLGGWAAIRLARLRPVRAVLVLSPGGAPAPLAELATLSARFRLQRVVDALAFVDAFVGRRRWWRIFLALGVLRRMRNPGVAWIADRIGPDALLRPDDLAALPAPTWVLWGGADGLLPSAGRAWFRQNLPDHVHFEEPEGWGHSPQVDRTRAVLRRMRSFLEAC